jgi:DNA recombination protein RmuC
MPVMALDPALAIAVIVAIVLGVAAIAIFVQSRSGAALARNAEKQATDLRQETIDLRERLAAANAEIAARDGRAEAERVAHEQRVADLLRLRGEMERDFRDLAQSALGENRQSFLTLANEVFAKHRAETGADVEARRKAVEDLVRPIGETLQQTRSKLEEIEKERADTFGQIRQQVQSVGEEAARLARALKANPGTRGRWGEESLRNALELAGLSAHCDFETQTTFARLDSSIRPDCVIRLPGGRCIVVDAKAPISAYLDAVDATDEAARVAGLQRHADTLRQHMLALARKDYAETVAVHLSARPDFVAMFIPGENFYAAAIERNGELFAEAVSNGILIVTPTTLIALAKAVALGWRQEAIAANAREVAALGHDLYMRLCVMGEHIVRLRASLDKSVRHFNSFVGSLEGSVLPQARRFRELGAAGGSRTLQLLEPVETEPREPAPSRDLILEMTAGERPAALLTPEDYGDR